MARGARFDLASFALGPPSPTPQAPSVHPSSLSGPPHRLPQAAHRSASQPSVRHRYIACFFFVVTSATATPVRAHSGPLMVTPKRPTRKPDQLIRAMPAAARTTAIVAIPNNSGVVDFFSRLARNEPTKPAVPK